MNGRPSKYELRALEEINEWKSPKPKPFGGAMQAMGWPLNQAGDLITKTPGLGDAITSAISGIISVSNDVALWAINAEKIYGKFRAAGHDVHQRCEVFALDLEDVDKTVGLLAAKYKGLALAEGAAAGAAGIPGILADIPALVTLNLSAIGEYATYYGFDVSLQGERLYVMNVLGLASSPKDAAKQVAMAQLTKIAKDVAKKKPWEVLGDKFFVKIIQDISKALGIRLTKAKLAQVVPIVGALVGGGFNAYYTARVCDTAYYLYRERFLAEKHGPDWIDVVVGPAKGFDPGYDEQFEEVPEDSQERGPQ